MRCSSIRIGARRGDEGYTIGVSFFESAGRDFILEYRNWSIVDDIARRDVNGSISYCNRVTVYWSWRRATIDSVEYRYGSAGRRLISLSIRIWSAGRRLILLSTVTIGSR